MKKRTITILAIVFVVLAIITTAMAVNRSDPNVNSLKEFAKEKGYCYGKVIYDNRVDDPLAEIGKTLGQTKWSCEMLNMLTMCEDGFALVLAKKESDGLNYIFEIIF